MNGSGGGTYHDLSDRVMITANPPAEGMVFDRWIGNSEPQYFEGMDQWKKSTEYIEDILIAIVMACRPARSGAGS